MAVDASIVFLPRFTTLVGAGEFTTLPLDVSQYGGAQFQVWVGDMRGTSPDFTLFLEESLDTEHWDLGVSPTPIANTIIPGAAPTLFSYGFRLRWFRLRVVLGGTGPIATCWAEGLLRGSGGGGRVAPLAPAGAATTFAETTLGAVTPPAPAPGRAAGPLDPRFDPDPFSTLRTAR